MCGILGSVNFDFNSSHMDLISHRGPDDFGINSFSINGGTVLLGHRRLSIIDLSSSGHQPMISPCLGYALVFNGEIYNHLELRSRLPESLQYHGHSDTETILHYLMHYGIDAVKDFNGIFALAFLDSAMKSLYIARDPIGVKPLYYYLSDNNLIFSSEIRPIKSMLGGVELNSEALASLLRLRFNPSPDTIAASISKLEPGNYIEIGIGSSVVTKRKNYFASKSKKKAIRAGSIKELTDSYGFQLQQAVRRQMLSDVEIGIFLSGGVDSAVVAALAKMECGSNLKAFTIGFDGDYEEDEIQQASESAKILGLEHHYKRMTFTDFLEIIKSCTNIVEEPLATTSMIPMYYLAELASKHVKVVLTGQGADEPLGGYMRYRAERYRCLIPRGVRKVLMPATNILSVKNDQLFRALRSIGIEDQMLRFLAIYEVFSDEEIYRLISVRDSLSEVRLRKISSLSPCFEGKQSVEKMMAVDTRMSLSDDLLNYTDKITMHFSLECRVPMLDLELLEYIESLPLECKINFRHGKVIHKKFAERLLPSEIVHRRKSGFQSPTKKWFLEEMGLIKDILLTEGSMFSRIFRQSAVKEVLDQHVSGFNKERHIFLLLSIYYRLCDYTDSSGRKNLS